MRWLRHLFARPAASAFPAASLQRITAAIAQAEQAHRGLQVDAAQWQAICQRMATALRAGEYERAALEAIAATSALLAAQFPRPPGQAFDNELADRPTLLG